MPKLTIRQEIAKDVMVACIMKLDDKSIEKYAGGLAKRVAETAVVFTDALITSLKKEKGNNVRNN